MTTIVSIMNKEYEMRKRSDNARLYRITTWGCSFLLLVYFVLCHISDARATEPDGNQYTLSDDVAVIAGSCAAIYVQFGMRFPEDHPMYTASSDNFSWWRNVYMALTEASESEVNKSLIAFNTRLERAYADEDPAAVLINLAGYAMKCSETRGEIETEMAKQ